MELYKGLPLRTVEATTKENEYWLFSVTTEAVNELVTSHLEEFWHFENSDFYKEIEEFDNNYSYAVPQDVFESADDKELIKYINDNIDNYYKI